MKFKEGDKVKLVRMEDENIDLYKKYLGQEFEIATIMPNTNPHCTLKGNINISPYLKNLELVKDYTYEDLKKSPIGTKITFENGVFLIKRRDNHYESKGFWREDIDLEGMEDTLGTLGKIIKIEEPTYRTVYEAEKEILDEAEKRYLRGVIRPFRDKVKYVKKIVFFDGDTIISIRIEENNKIWYIEFPPFKKDRMYKGMEEDKEYTLEELGL